MAALADLRAPAVEPPVLDGSARAMPLYGRGGVRAFTVVDAEDYDRFARHRWQVNSYGYAVRTIYGRENGRKTQRSVLLHREILGLEFGDPRKTDHIDRDTLNNRRSNLRIVTHAQNHQNRAATGDRGASSRYRGVCWRKDRAQWCAYGDLHGRHHHLGFFDDEQEAADAAARWREQHMPFSMN